MIGSFALSSVAAAANSVAMPPQEFPNPILQNTAWAQEMRESDVRVRERAYLTSFKANSSSYLLHSTNFGSDWDAECIVLEVSSNSAILRGTSIVSSEIPQLKGFQKGYLSFIKAVASQSIEKIVDDALSFNAALKQLDWRPTVWSDEGEIVFEWISPGKHAVASIEGDGRIGYTMLVDGRFISGADHDAVARDIPADLKEYLLAV